MWTLIFTILSGSLAFSQNYSWVYTDEQDQNVRVDVYDVSNRYGEEYLTIYMTDRDPLIVKPSSVGPTEYEAEIYMEASDGSVLMDRNLSLSKGESFSQFLLLMKESSFREAFEYLPEECPSQANAFLMVADNLTGKMYGYCLVPQT